MPGRRAEIEIGGARLSLRATMCALPCSTTVYTYRAHRAADGNKKLYEPFRNCTTRLLRSPPAPLYLRDKLVFYSKLLRTGHRRHSSTSSSSSVSITFFFVIPRWDSVVTGKTVHHLTGVGSQSTTEDGLPAVLLSTG